MWLTSWIEWVWGTWPGYAQVSRMPLPLESNGNVWCGSPWTMAGWPEQSVTAISLGGCGVGSGVGTGVGLGVGSGVGIGSGLGGCGVGSGVGTGVGLGVGLGGQPPGNASVPSQQWSWAMGFPSLSSHWWAVVSTANATNNTARCRRGGPGAPGFRRRAI